MILGGPGLPENVKVRTIICQKCRPVGYLAVLRLFGPIAKPLNIIDYVISVINLIQDYPTNHITVLWATAHLYDVGTEPLPE